MQRSLVIFEESIKTEATRKAYLYHLEQFLKWTKIKDFDSLLQAPQKNLQILLEDYVMHLKRKVSPNSVPIYFAPIELFFVMNDVIINYKKLRKLFPGKAKKGNYRGYTIEKIFKNFELNKKLLDLTNDAMNYYLTRSNEYYEEHEEIVTWHNFFSKHAWNSELQKSFKSFLKGREDDLKELRSQLK